MQWHKEERDLGTSDKQFILKSVWAFVAREINFQVIYMTIPGLNLLFIYVLQIEGILQT